MYSAVRRYLETALEKQSSYSKHRHANAEGRSFPYGHYLLGFHVQALFDYQGLCLHRRSHLLRDATGALLLKG